MSNQIFTATGCARCKIVKRFLQQENIAYEEFDIKAEGHDAFAKFYREHRKDIYRDADGVEFPLFSDGSAIRQGASVILGYLIARDDLSPFIRRNTQHGEWIDGFDLSGGKLENAEDLLRVLAFLKQNSLKIQMTTDGRNSAVLGQVVAEGLADRVIMEVKGPADLYGRLIGEELAPEEIHRSIAFTAKAPEHAFYTMVKPVAREDGTFSYLTPEEVGQTAKMIEEASGGKKNPYCLRRWLPEVAQDERIDFPEPLPESAMFKYRTAARRYQVMSEIDK